MMVSASLESRLERLEDRLAVRELIDTYAEAVDDHDMERMMALFASDAMIEWASGKVLRGSAAIRQFYENVMGLYVITRHIPHMQTVTWIDHDRAQSTVTSTVERSFSGRWVLTALRYNDRYIRLSDGWRFQHRFMQYMYVVPVEELPTAFADDIRIRTPGEPPSRAHYPETLPTWTTYASRP